MIHSLNERPSKLEFKSDIISVFRKNKISEVVRVTNVLYIVIDYSKGHMDPIWWLAVPCREIF